MNDSNLKKMSDDYENCPPVLYKYCSLETAIKIIINQEIRFSIRSQFNDPFDLAPKLDLDDLIADRCPGLNPKELEKSVIASYDMHKVLCLSERKDHILMWSRYADNHKGVCLTFSGDKIKEKWHCLSEIMIDTVCSFFGQNFVMNDKGVYVPYTGTEINASLVTKVEYSDKRSKYKPSCDLKESLKKIFATKCDVWGYEEEWRVIRNFPTNPNLNQKHTEEYVHIPKDMIIGCTFGINVDDNARKCFINLCEKLEFNIKFQKAKMHDTEYEIEYEDV